MNGTLQILSHAHVATIFKVFFSVVVSLIWYDNQIYTSKQAFTLQTVVVKSNIFNSSLSTKMHFVYLIGFGISISISALLHFYFLSTLLQLLLLYYIFYIFHFFILKLFFFLNYNVYKLYIIVYYSILNHILVYYKRL